MNKFCIFCGGKPEDKNLEHVIPLWLIEHTGDPNRKVNIGANWRKFKILECSLDQFVLPACTKCNSIYSTLEAVAKNVVLSMLAQDPLSAEAMHVLLFWLDKIRVGLWLAYLQLGGNVHGVRPKFYISQRVDANDRMVLIYRTSDPTKSLSWAGVNSPFFDQMPSCFGLRINQLFLVNISKEFLFSGRLGLPYSADRYWSDTFEVRGTMQPGFRGYMYPLIEAINDKTCCAIYQPIINPSLRDRASMAQFFSDEYARQYFEPGSVVGRVLIDQGDRIVRYPAEASPKWIPPFTYPRETFPILIRKVYALQNWLIDQRPSPDKLSSEKKEKILRQVDWMRQSNKMLMEQLPAMPDDWVPKNKLTTNLTEIQEAFLDYIAKSLPEEDATDVLRELMPMFAAGAGPQAVLKLASSAYDVGTRDPNKARYMKLAIDACQEALKVYPVEVFPMRYAAAQDKLGLAYWRLAEVEDQAVNARRAIDACQEALKVRTFKENPVGYASTQGNLACAYGILAQVKGKARNCKRAITACQEALKVYTLDQFPTDYANTQGNLGVLYQTLAEVEAKAENSKKGIDAHEGSLKVYTLQKFPMDYAMAQSNLACAYGTLAEVEAKADNSRKAISACEEALRILTLEGSPLDYAKIQNNIAGAYRKLAEVEAKAENSKKAITALEESLKVYTFDRFPRKYAMAQSNLAAAYGTLAEVEAKAENCRKAITACGEAFKVDTFEDFPIQYAFTQHELGTAYATLAEVEAKEENCKKAIDAYNEALKVRTFERFPMDYATTQNNLAAAYGTLADVGAKAENLKKAITACEEALKVRTLERYPIDYATIQNNLASGYRTLAEVEAKAENCRKAITACEEALKVFSVREFPESHALVEENLISVLDFCKDE